jgi:hypothetical protein
MHLVSYVRDLRGGRDSRLVGRTPRRKYTRVFDWFFAARSIRAIGEADLTRKFRQTGAPPVPYLVKYYVAAVLKTRRIGSWGFRVGRGELRTGASDRVCVVSVPIVPSAKRQRARSTCRTPRRALHRGRA